MNLPRPALSVQQAIAESNTLSSLMDRMRLSHACLQVTQANLPLGLQSACQAGPMTDGVWCLLVDQSSAMVKLKQLKPALLNHLIRAGLGVKDIRLKRVY